MCRILWRPRPADHFRDASGIDSKRGTWGGFGGCVSHGSTGIQQSPPVIAQHKPCSQAVNTGYLLSWQYTNKCLAGFFAYGNSIAKSGFSVGCTP